MTRFRVTKAQLAAAENGTTPDVLAPGVRLLFCGINPSLYSVVTGCHFARPGNRFWPALHDGGFTPRLFHPSENEELLTYGCGITNLAPRGTRRADELSRDELEEGAEELAAKVEANGVRTVAFLGVTAYRTAFAEPGAVIGRQERTVGGADVWVLPNPSGLNAHYQRPDFARLFGELRAAVFGTAGAEGR
ncbi:G/U mismatch-specific DNA glycosylase [Alienimonas californiensis]|uniref:G/U mismatch-specific DNA glycosylase n=1 Tax=Alienimonas californiensis TaxID=2527989 RepID=A0A517P5B3_9PLAN|nr:G/U mismatch-specific DNA glycosylase [Alienimonas californiensis]QDT14563.1 G/U mismatch-specific DNA glycosylase [Alienimonas californiensis]